MKKIKKTIATVAAVATSAVTVVAAGGVINKAWDYDGLSYKVDASPVLNAGYSIVRFYFQTGGNQRPDTLYAAAKEYVESLYPDCDVQGPYSQSGPALPDADETLEFWFLAYDANTSTDPEAEGLVKEDVVADTGLEVTPAEETLEVGENFQIIATKNLVFTKNVDYIVVSGSADSSGSSVGSTRYTNQESAAGILSYQSADDSIATVNAEGYVTAQGVGTTTITVTSTAPVGLTSGTYTLNTVNGGSSATNNITVGEPSILTATVNVTVTEIPEIHPTDVTMDTPSVTLNGEIDTVTASGTESLTVGEEGTSSGSVSVKYGQSAELTASVSPEGADQTVTWSSSDPSVATVNNGTVTAVKAGTATVTATSAADDTKKATSSITVTDPSKDVTWSSSDPSIVEVDPATGDTTAKAIGAATITATSVADSSKSDSYTVTVAAAPDDTVYPNGISLDSDNYEVEVGGTKQASVAFDPTNTTDKSVTWEITSGSEFASVDANGLIHGLKKGEATLKATAVSKDADGKEVSATAKVTVTDPDEGRYTVTFVTDHATAPDAVRVNAGEKVTNPGNLAEEGFIFLGWYTDSNHTTAVDWDAPINENKTYYAGWDRETPERITVVFDGNGGTIGGQSSTSEDVEIVDGNATVTGLAPAAERDGYTLTGWNSSADGTGVNIGDVIANAQDKATYTFYAQWEEVYNGPTDFGIDFGTSGGSVKVGESIQLGTKNWSPDGLPAESKEVTWSVANGTGSATIDETGKLTGTAVGTVEVTATSKVNPELTRTATVNVLPADAELIEPTDVDITDPSTGVSLDDITLQEGETKQLDAVITPADANTNTGKTWSIADPSVATVDQNGNVTGVKYGTTTVTVTLDNGVQDTATVTVTPVNPTDFGTSGGSVKVGESIQLGTKNWSPDGLPAESKEVTWSVANGTGSATIDETGKLTGTAVGTVEVTATSKVNPELTRTATVNVLPADAELIEPTDVDITDPSTGVSLDDITLQEGETKQLDAVITPADANTNTGKTWSIADPSVATVDQNGNVTGVKYGTTTVTVTLDNGVQDTATVTVTPVNPTDFGIDFGTSGGSVKVGESIQLGTKNWSPDGLPAESKEVTWSVANGTGSATIDETGKLTGTAVGTVEVTATSKVNPELTRTATVNVLPADAELIEPTDVDIIDPSASVSLDDITLQEGETKQLDAVITPADANTNTGKTWSIADPSVATVDQNGKVTAIKAGTTTVTVILDNGVRDTAAVTVTPKPVENTDVEPTGADIVDPFTGVSINDIELQEGTTRALDAVITPSNANVHTRKSWSIADTSIATVDQNGNVTGIKAGVTTVTVTLENGVKDTATVKVTAKPTENTDIEPTGVSIGTKDVYLYVGNTKTLTATITPANANVHTNKTWSIANSAIAVIDQNGTVTGVKAGTTTVRVTLANGVSDTATVHVLDVSTPSYTVTFNGNGGVINGSSTATATADGAYTLYSNSFPTATRSGYNFSGWNTSANGTGTWVSAPYTFKANTTLYAQWSAATVAPTSVDISVPVITANPNGTVNTTYVSADSMNLKVGETKPIKATVLPANATDKSVTYSIADPSIARIDQNGNITGLRAGVTTATVRTVNGLTDTITVTVTPNSSMPNLYIEDIKPEYPAGKAIPVTLNILDPDRGERLYVYYQIDNETPVLADTITATGNWQDVEVELPSNIAIGKHSFSFFVRDAAGNRSDDNGYAYIYNGDAYITDVDKYNPNRYDPSTWGTRFKADVTNTAPTLSLAAKLQDKVRIGDQLPANLTVKDENVGQKVTIYYQIDSGNPVEAGSFVSDGNAKNISVNVPTAGISEGDHVVTFYAVDEAGMKSNANGNVNAWNALGTNAGANQQTVTFTKGDGTSNTNGGNAPIVDIFKASGYKTTEDVAVTISVLEKDAGQKVTTYYSLDNGPETVIKSFKSTGRANTQQLNLGKLSEGTHTLEVWAIDEDGNRSDAADGLYTFSVSKASDGTVTVIPTPKVYNTSTIKTGVEAKASKAGIAAAVIGAVAAIGTVLKRKRK